MAANVSPTFRLARDGCHAHLSDHGAFIGGTVPLLERNALGRWQPRSQAALERLLAIGYGERVDLGWRMTKLASVARALLAYGNGTSDYPNEILEAAQELSNNPADPAMALERILHRRSRR